MARFQFPGRGRSGGQGGTAAPAAPQTASGRPRGRRSPMGLADAKASNNLLIGLGIGLITTVTGLSAAGTFTAINAMNRQSEESIAEAERYQQELDRQQAAAQNPPGGTGDAGSTGSTGGSQPGGTQGGTEVVYPEDPGQQPVTQQPVQVDGMTREEFISQLPEQIQWMIEKHITYDEYGLPRDEFGSLMNDPTTEIYDPARWSYFFNESNEEKEPKKEDLPTQSEIDLTGEAGGDDEFGEESGGDGRPVTPVSELPVKAPDQDDNYAEGNYEPEAMPIQNPAVETVPGHTSGDGSGGSSSDPTSGSSGGVTAPSVETPSQDDDDGDWWEDDDGEPLDGLVIDENGEPYYVVAPGDSLGTISRKYGFAMSDVVTENGIVNPNVLNVGDIIRFPASGPSVKKPQVTTPGGTSGTSGNSGNTGNTGKTDGVTTGNATGGSATGLG